MSLDIPDTHKSLPLGLEPEDFGQVGRSANSGIFVISTLSSPLYLTFELNEYVLFVTNSTSISSIKWSIKAKAKADDVEVMHDAPEFDDEFVFSCIFSDYMAEEGEITVNAAVTESSGTLVNVTISYTVLTSDVLDYFELDYISYAGNKEDTSVLINHYSPYIRDAAKAPGMFGEPNDIPESLIAAYISYCNNPFSPDEILYDEDYSLKESMGLCRLHPDLVSHVYLTPSDEEKINLLRFPKSNILICRHILSKIKSTSEWPDLDADAFRENEQAVEFVAQVLYSSCTPDYLNKYSPLETVLSNLEATKLFGPDSPSYALAFRQGRRIYQTMGSPWCRTFFYGEKNIRGGIYDEDGNELHISNVRVDVFWEIDRISQDVIEKTNDGYSKEYRVRIISSQLSVFNSRDTGDPYKIGNTAVKVKQWQVFRLLEIVETRDVSGNKLVWHRIQYGEGVEKWIVAFSGQEYARFEKVVKLIFDPAIVTNVQGKYEFTVYDTGLYFIRTVKVSRYRDGVTRDYHDGEFGWFLGAEYILELKVQMQSEDASARWVNELGIIERARHFDNWIYDIDYAHYPSVLNFHDNYLYTENEQIPQAGDRPAEPGTAPYRKTNCNTFCEAILVDTWEDIHVGFGWALNNSEHNLWVNAAGLAINRRLRVIEPSLVKRMGRCIYAVEKDGSGQDLNNIYNQNANPDETTPFPSADRDDVLPQAWTLVQHFDNLNDYVGHMYIILDYDEGSDKFLVLEASRTVSTRRSSGTNGPRVRGLFHVDCLTPLTTNPFTFRITEEWASIDLNLWDGLKGKKGLALVKLYVHDLQLTRPPSSIGKVTIPSRDWITN